MPIVCVNRPNRSRKRVFTERDVGRIIAYAREDGADDILLVANILQGLGLRRLVCVLFELLNVLSRSLFLGALLSGISNALVVIKALKILATGRRSTIPGILELVVPKRWLGGLGVFLLGIGTVGVFLSASLAFISALAQNIQLFLLARGACRLELPPPPVTVGPIRVGSLIDDLEALVKALQSEGM